MTDDDHHRYAEWVAAYALGALDGEDRRAFEAHLATCETCAAELASLAPLPGLLAKVDPADVERDADPARGALVGAAAHREVVVLHRRARRWRVAALAAAVAAAVLAVVLVVPPGRDGGDGGDGGDGPALVAASVVSSVASTADVAVSARGWGTEITLAITGLPSRPSYQLWTVAADGDWTSAATWLPTPSGDLRLTGASRTPTDQLARILVTSQERDDVLVDAAV